MSDIAIHVENLGKQYHIGALEKNGGRYSYKSLRDSISGVASAPLRMAGALLGLNGRHENHQEETIWALKDVSFDVKRGEIVGVIGRNGAGKSTLLKVLSRITEPSTGFAEIHGRIGSLLEVGTGFHPELSGRDNVYMNGAILGMKRAEIAREFDAIVAFAEVEKFIDTPVKHYSSGMYLRLAFAVAAHLQTEILIIDEVLAVGDVEFQKKCMGKMQEASQGGRTVLFVSHNLQAVSTLTTRCILLDGGKLSLQGSTQSTLNHYLKTKRNQGLVYEAERLSSPCVVRLEVITSEPGNVHAAGAPMSIIADIWTPHPIKSAGFSIQITDSLTQQIAHFWLYDSEKPLCRTAGIHHLRCNIPGLRLYIGRYTLTTHLASKVGDTLFERLEEICPFEVIIHGRSRQWSWQENECCYLEDFQWETELAASSSHSQSNAE
jgi:lipopolysaccharide transport system ATP-binding protein